MSTGASDLAVIARMSVRHQVSKDAVSTVLNALRAGGGTMAQFSHPEFGGMSQWAPGMTMVGDMFNDRLKAKLDALASDLAAYLRDAPMPDPKDRQGSTHDRTGGRSAGGWWPAELGTPSSTGSQNDMRYAVFPTARRLVVDDHGTVTTYDTGDHVIHGASQAQSSERTLSFASQKGTVRLTDLARVKP